MGRGKLHDLVVSVVILTALGIAALLAAHVGTGLSAALGTLGVGLLIELLADSVEVLSQLIGSGLDGGGIGALQGLLQLVDTGLDLALILGGDLVAHLGEGKPGSTFEVPELNEPFKQVWRELSLLTAKKFIYCANVDEAGLEEDNEHVKALRSLTESRGCGMVKICARLEEELQGLSDAEQAEMLESYGIAESGLENIIRMGYHTLGLASFLTAGPKEVRAWTFHQGWKAPQAAGVIHTDFEKGFIRAEVISYEDYMKYKSEAACRAAGVLRVEGKDYVVKDGDMMNFRCPQGPGDKTSPQSRRRTVPPHHVARAGTS